MNIKVLDRKLIMLALIGVITAFFAVWLVLSNVAAQAEDCDTTVAGDGECLVGGKSDKIGQPVPAALIVSGPGGLEWVWAGPCATQGVPPGRDGFFCSGSKGAIDVGHDGFKFATNAQWALFPAAGFANGPCASPYFSFNVDNCDQGDFDLGVYGSEPSDHAPNALCPTLVVGSCLGPNNQHPLGETFLVRSGNPHPGIIEGIELLERKIDALDDHPQHPPQADLGPLKEAIASLEKKLDVMEKKSDALAASVSDLAASVSSLPSHPDNNQGNPQGPKK